ncbi:PQQ-binding-like beta-propeller repeat protein [Mitsuaria sp. 7]|uniref:outer membrane protein assembly factor BamB family protein n=1 Tax=Mitsuaria sp. 7 TaxID=1658665 RepID=UPI0009ED80EF|nr:PQQ-binding-like beta-propeller repeat protein [Mitsuaria sp. 7]
MQGILAVAFKRSGAALALIGLPLLMLAACGGGGGGVIEAGIGGGSGGGNADAFQLSFQPTSLEATFYAGEAPLLTVTATASRTHAAPVQVAVIDSVGVLSGQAELTATSQLVYRVGLRLSNSLPAGTHSGSLEVRVCEDAPTVCAKPVGASPWRLPYKFTVRPATNLSTLSAVPGGRGWSTYLGDAAQSGFQAVSLKAADFNRRWTTQIPATAMQASAMRASAFAVDDGLLFYVALDLTGRPPVLVAQRESDGSIAWTQALGSPGAKASSPTLANGEVFVVTSGLVASGSETELWRISQATGQILLRQSYSFSSTSQTAPLHVNGKLYFCLRSASGSRGLTRFDATTLQPDWTVPLSIDTCTPSSDGTSIYVFGDNKLTAIDASTGAVNYSIAAQTPGSYLTPPPVLDGRGRAYVAAYTTGSFTNDSSLIAFDLNTRTVAWQLSGHFDSNPVPVGDAVYVSNDRSLDARASSDGRLLWSWVSDSSGLDGLDSGLVVSNGHAFVASRWATHAIDLSTHASAWSDPLGGSLALSGQGVLYIGGYFGTGLRAVNLH